MLYILIEVEDITNMHVVTDDDTGNTLIFDLYSEAENFAERNCLDGRVMVIEE